MTDAELIAAQAKEIAELKIKTEVLNGMIDSAIGQMVCIGGPLNDNRLGYNKAQIAEWQRVADRLGA
jgi:hypothetical protein